MANYAGSVFSALTPIIALPFYLDSVGIKQWGLISFVSLLQSLFSMLDAGNSQALTRDVADKYQFPIRSELNVASLLAGFERIYWAIAIIGAFIIVLFANVITNYWIDTDGLPRNLGLIAVYGTAGLFLSQFPVSVYRSVLIGCERQVLANMISTVGVLFRHIGGVIVVLKWKSLEAYLLWHIFSMLLETILTSFIAWRSLKTNRAETVWSYSEIKQTLKMSAGLSFSVMLGILTLQLDKLILSWLLPLEELGVYAIAATAAFGSLRLISPIFNAVLPRLVQLRNQEEKLIAFNKKFVLIISILVFVSAAVYITFGYEILEIWLHDSSVVKSVYPLLSFLLIGTAMNAFYGVGYQNWLAKGKVKKVLIVNMTGLIISLPAMIVLILKYGSIGATFGWIFLNFIGLSMSLGWIKPSIIKGAVKPIQLK